MPADENYDASYFAGGRVSAEAIEKLFTACGFLFEVKPWTVAHDQQVLRMDIPALDVDGACVSVIGQRDAESPGVLVFPLSWASSSSSRRRQPVPSQAGRTQSVPNCWR